MKRKHLTPNQKIDYKTAQDLIFHSFYPHLIDTNCIQSGSNSVHVLGQELESLPIDDALRRLRAVVCSAVTKSTTPRTAQTVDELQENTPFTQDALLFHFFMQSIKLRNMPMIVLILKVWAIS